MSDEEAAFETEFDVRLRQQMPIRNAMQAEIEKMAMFDELVDEIGQHILYGNMPPTVYEVAVEKYKRARALQERSK
jgi:hypothetical protein